MNPTSPTEERLVLALRQHRSTDFSLVYDAYAPTLYALLRRLVIDPALAEDLLQDTFVKIWLNRQGYDAGQGRLSTWMVTIARHVALDALRAQKARQLSRARFGDAAEKITHPAHREGTVNGSLLRQLVPKQRDIIELMYFQGYSGQEIATTLNIPLGTVKTRARLALQQLKVYLHQDIHHYQAG